MTRRDWQRPFRMHGCVQVLGIGVMLWVSCVGIAAQELTPWTSGPTPLLELTDYRGMQHALAAYRNRVILVNFWATWCEPCREEMPALQALQNKLVKAQVVVLAVNYGESPEKVQQFVQQVPVDFPLLLDRHMETAKAWQVRVLPTSFVLGQDGQIRYSAVGLLDWSDPQVVKLLTELSPRP
jgi:thiol-disulfide isomerase/thioredoxin